MEKIDTAPKDETIVIGWSKRWGFNVWAFKADNTGPAYWQCVGGYDMDGAEEPTHWAPLPDEPA